MCYSCWADYGCPVLVPEDVDEIVGWIKELYDLPGGDMGGPLHVELDDFNVGCAWDLHDPSTIGYEPFSEEVIAVATKIRARMLELPEEVRAAVLAYWGGWITAEKTVEWTWEP